MPFQAVLIVGPPWIGKTFIAQQFQALRVFDAEPFSTNLDRHSVGLPLQPVGWDKWLSSDRRATWIIDSLDEGESIQDNLHQILLRDLELLTPDARSRLKIIVFCREVSLPRPLLDGLKGIYKGNLAAVELLGLTRAGERHMLSEATFGSVLEKIREHDLQSVAQFPAPLRHIERHLGMSLTKDAIWEGVLKELLDEKNERKRKRASNDLEIEDRFSAAKHLACVMTFAGIDRVAADSLDTNSPPLDKLIRQSPPGVGPSRQAAQRALESAVFTVGRFAQKHVREWMCAFALKDLVLGRIKGLLTESDGSLNRAHLGILSLLAQVGRPEIRDWVIAMNGGLPPQSDHPLGLADVRHLLDRIEEIAEASPWNLRFWNEPSVTQLRVRGVGAELARRLRDGGRSPLRRILLLQIAASTDSRAAVEPAIEILCDSTAPPNLVESALIVVKRLAIAGQLQRLAAFVRTSRPKSRVRKAAVSALIKRFLDEGFWAIEDAVKYCPEPHDDVIDSTHVLENILMERLTVPAARFVIKRFLPKALKQGSAAEASPPRRGENLLHRAITVILGQGQPAEGDFDALLPLAVRQWECPLHLRFDFRSAFRKSEVWRRKLYLADLQYHREQGKEAAARSFRWILLPDDIEWLIEQLPTLALAENDVWDDVLIAANHGSNDLQERAKTFVEKHRPGIVVSFEAGLERYREWERKHQAEVEEAARAKHHNEVQIGQYTAEILERSDYSLQQKMWALSSVCFPSEHARPVNLVGTWDDLDTNVQRLVLDVCVEGIHDCQPTSVPMTNGVPQTVLFEGWCFRAVLTYRPKDVRLDSEIIKKWLPAMLHWSIYWDTAVIEACHDADRSATESVFLIAIERELQSESRHAVTASNMPELLWTKSLREKLAEFVANKEFAVTSRGDLLNCLFERDPALAISLARETLQANSETELAKPALNVLLRLSPNDAWPRLREDLSKGDIDGLLSLGQLFDYRNYHAFSNWPAERLYELASMLFSAFPPSADPEGLDGFVTPEMLCRQLRDAIPAILFNRGGSEDRKLLANLVTEHKRLKRWHERALAEESARRILGGAAHQFLPLETVLDVLANADHRFVRQADDLIEIIEEQVRAISATIGEDFELFYHKGTRKPQHEGTLQAYFLRRLSDRLPGRVLDPNATVINLDREHQGKFLRRKDILITATCLDGTKAAVVVEIKWSSNTNIATSLARQLGDQYLRAEERTHGIYLVAWNGTCRGWKTGAKRAAPKSCQELTQVLEKQASGYNRKHDRIRINSFVFDLEWLKKARKRSRGTPNPKPSAKKAAQQKSRQRKKTSNGQPGDALPKAIALGRGRIRETFSPLQPPDEQADDAGLQEAGGRAGDGAGAKRAAEPTAIE